MCARTSIPGNSESATRPGQSPTSPSIRTRAMSVRMVVRTSGISFGKGEDLGRLISVVIVVVVLFLVKFALDSNEKKSLFFYGLITGGAIGNLADRVFRSDSGFLKGKVVDFIDFQWWPVFNIADSAVVLGCLFLVFNGLRRARV